VGPDAAHNDRGQAPSAGYTTMPMTVERASARPGTAPAERVTIPCCGLPGWQEESLCGPPTGGGRTAVSAFVAERRRHSQGEATTKSYSRGVGAWGVEPFDNDDAADWSAEFEGAAEPAGLELLRSALAAVDSPGYLEAPDGAIGVAAAQVVAWLLQPDTAQESPYAAAVIGWLRTNTPSAGVGLVGAARRALSSVRSSDSELAELWAEANEAEWERVLDRIDLQLRSGG